jgi:hypothetical protein
MGDIDKDAYKMAKFALREDYKEMKQCIAKYKENKSNAWALIYDQCMVELKNRIEGTAGYDKAKNNNNVVNLLAMIHGYCCQFDTLNDEYFGLVKVFKNLFFFYQKEGQSNADYHEDFLALTEVIEEYGGAGCITHFPTMMKKELTKINESLDDASKATPEQRAQAKLAVRNKFLAALMLNGANEARYGDLSVGVYIVWSVRSKDRPYLTWILKLKSILVGSWLQDDFPLYFHFIVFESNA